MPSFSHVLLLEHLDLDAVALAELLRLLGEVGRRADVAGEVAEILGERDALGDRLAARDRRSRPRRSRCGSRRAARPCAARAWPRSALLFSRSKRYDAVHDGEHRLLDLPAGVAALERQVREADRGLGGAGGLSAFAARGERARDRRSRRTRARARGRRAARGRPGSSARCAAAASCRALPSRSPRRSTSAR